MKTEIRNRRYGKCKVYLYNKVLDEYKHEFQNWEYITIDNDRDWSITYRNDDNTLEVKTFTQWDTEEIVLYDEDGEPNTAIEFN